MATLEVKLIAVSARAITGLTLPIADSVPLDEQTITLSGSSQQSSLSTAAVPGTMAWSVKAVGAAARVKFGANPTAVAASGGWHISDGERLQLGVSGATELLAAITAT